MLKLGCHVSMKGEKMFLGSVEEALSYGANVFMVYTGAPQNTLRKPVSALRIDEARALMTRVGIDVADVVVHAPYIINLATPEESKRRFAVDFLVAEIERTAAMGARQIVLHPGSHLGEGLEEGVRRIASNLDEVIERTAELDVLIALETMSGKGTEVGRSFEELCLIFERVRHPGRLSVCFDTCHTHDAGYAVKSAFNDVIETFDSCIGKHRISVFHVNDSKNPKGANKDRHANIGTGLIGFDALDGIVHHADFTAIPKILETPYVTETETSKKRVYAPYKEEIAMLKERVFRPGLLEEIRTAKRGA